MEQPTRQLIRRLGAVLIAAYLGIVVALALLKAATPVFERLSWAEVVYGPAIKSVSIFLLCVLGIWIELKIRVRLTRRSCRWNPAQHPIVDREPDR